MGIVNNQPSVIHLLSEADFSANTYFKVFALTAEAVTINDYCGNCCKYCSYGNSETL